MTARAARRQAGSRRAGFSLIEIMAVMLILGVILMSIVPAIDGLVPIYRLRGAAREVASLMELAQSEAVGTRKEYQIAYSIDRNSYWLVLPPRDPAEDEQQDPAAAMGGLPAGELNKEGRPIDDLEHGPPPVDPNGPQDPRAARTSMEREALLPKGLPTDVVFVSVIVGDDEKRTGEVLVPFSHLGAGGTHIVGLRLENGAEADQIWVKFNALTRTIEYHEERPAVRTLSQGDLR
ncbi:MAG: prepilin-type N-terminal cleavage/methylation domain-containing protein [Planctomycetes bacterium]|nr:prepilin-type N-terminal cleavage/methylation domain-containing protein [Planctomycetota bacterium]